MALTTKHRGLRTVLGYEAAGLGILVAIVGLLPESVRVHPGLVDLFWMGTIIFCVGCLLLIADGRTRQQ